MFVPNVSIDFFFKFQSSTELSCRIQAAQQLYNRLSIGRRKELLFQMKYLAEAYVDWANTDVDKYKTNTGNT